MMDPILIIGAARSGTSLVAGSVHACGAFGGQMVNANPANPKGYFENRRLRERVLKPLLRGLKGDVRAQKPLPEMRLVHSVARTKGKLFRAAVIGQMRQQGYREGPWFYKCPKSAHVWPIWHAAFPDARWVIVRRADEQIIDSCIKTRFMRGYSTREGWQSWVDAHKTRFQEIIDSGLKHFEIWPESIVSGDLEQIKALIAWLELDWNEAGVLDFVSPALWSGAGKE